MHLAVTPTPSMRWVIQQLRQAMPFGLQPRYLLRDNEKIYGSAVPTFLERCGIEEVRTAYRSPWQNPYIERFIGALRRELLDHVIILNQNHLRRLLREYIDEYYHVARPHQGLNRGTPIPQMNMKSTAGARIISIPVVGGLHHRYERIAA